eukprot:CAMPEP_0171911812 /NCGR_PEP_ID=MMETSP0993-20121228/10583_1 /TAXON_ID=483369 /ORGANISM="non described non described, Strain CCMP2098" /LENGTH=80 /DNA_ID=CAMNT_0012545427 /DNA_START=167 /DNA_END=409 /DNA_ORIENTATION=+
MTTTTAHFLARSPLFLAPLSRLYSSARSPRLAETEGASAECPLNRLAEAEPPAAGVVKGQASDFVIAGSTLAGWTAIDLS